ncbi:MAG: PqqD family protein [Pseudomonadota bacterium]
MNFLTGRYFALRGAAVEVWSMLARPVSAQTLGAALAEGYGRTPAEVAGEVEALLAQLEEETLIVRIESAAERPAPPAPSGPYAAPTLEVFDELSELIALDPIHDIDPEQGWPVLPERAG